VRAAVLQTIGRPLAIEELSLDPPSTGEVRVRLLASGVCHSDVHRADGDWGGLSDPLVLGHEGAGIVEAVGPEVDPALTGRLVALSWYAPCGVCRRCAEGREWLCTGSGSLDHLQMDGTTRLHSGATADVRAYLAVGTFAQHEVVSARAAIPLPAETPPEVAALISCCVATGVGAVVNTAVLPSGASAVVIGLGGVGLSAVMGAALREADPLIAVDRVPAKLELARELGATTTILVDDLADPLRRIDSATGGGAEFTFETAGTGPTAELAVAATAPGGTAVLVGLPAIEARAWLEPYAVVDGSRTIIGSNYGWTVGARDFPMLAERYLEGRLPIDRLIEERIELDDVNRAMDALRRGDGARRVIVFPQP
jgi:S-(hydroxymethyl)glutathione dehydrogenase/alcohol dehydrogenase